MIVQYAANEERNKTMQHMATKGRSVMTQVANREVWWYNMWQIKGELWWHNMWQIEKCDNTTSGKYRENYDGTTCGK